MNFNNPNKNQTFILQTHYYTVSNLIVFVYVFDLVIVIFCTAIKITGASANEAARFPKIFYGSQKVKLIPLDED